MGKVDRLRCRVEHFAALLWALAIVQLPAPDPASHPFTALHKSCSYTVTPHYGSILNKDAKPPPLFLSRYAIYLWPKLTTVCVSFFSLAFPGPGFPVGQPHLPI